MIFQTISSFIALNLTEFFYKQALYYCLLILVCYKTVNSKGLGQEVLTNKKKEDFSARFMYSMNNKVTCFSIKTSILKYMQLIPFTVSNEHTLWLFIHFHKWKSSSQKCYFTDIMIIYLGFCMKSITLLGDTVIFYALKIFWTPE